MSEFTLGERKELQELRTFVFALRAELRGADTLPDLLATVRMLRTATPDERLRIERNYWHGRAMDLAEERDALIRNRKPRLLFAGDAADPAVSMNAPGPAKPEAEPVPMPAPAVSAAEDPVPADIPAETPTAPPPNEAWNQVVAQMVTVTTSEEASPREMGRELLLIRQRLGWSQARMAEALGRVGQSELSKMERGMARIRPEHLQRARALQELGQTPQPQPPAPPPRSVSSYSEFPSP